MLRCLERFGCDAHIPANTTNAKSPVDEMVPIMEELETLDAALDDTDIPVENELLPSIESTELEEELLSVCTTNITNKIHDTALAGPPQVDAKILDGAFIVQLLSPKTSRLSKNFQTPSSCLTFFLSLKVSQGWMLCGMSTSPTA